MIQKKGEIQIEDIQISEGKAYITGVLAVCLLYVSRTGVRSERLKSYGNIAHRGNPESGGAGKRR